MVRDGPEIARALVNKVAYSRLILLWDHHGSGWHCAGDEAVARIEERLEGVTWADRSAAVVMVPELEEWLWHCPASLGRYLDLSDVEFEQTAERAAIGLKLPGSAATLKTQKSCSTRCFTSEGDVNLSSKTSAASVRPPIYGSGPGAIPLGAS
jgi:hypothetical protein